MARRFVLALLMAAAVASASAAQPSFLWQVRGDGPGTVYLLGTVHLLHPDAAELSPAMEAAYAAADRLVVEVDLDRLEGAAAAMFAAGTLPEGSSLQQALSPETWTRLEAAAEGGAIPLQLLGRFRPWLVAMTLTVDRLRQAGYSDALGVDRRLLSRARSDHKEVVALETTEQQIGFFADLSQDQDEAFLLTTLSEMEELEPLMAELTAAWQRGDSSRAAELLAEGFADAPELFDRLVIRRNQAWLPTIEGFLAEPKTTLVAVGALHLVGEHGLVATLAAGGRRVEQR